MPKRPDLTDAQRAAARERQRKYNAKPESKAIRAAYYQRPEVKEKYAARNATEAQREYMRQWRQSEVGKARLKAAGLRQRAFTLELWASLMELQGGACAICRKPFSANLREIHADHCHDEAKPRGLLCQPCNHAEGQIRKTGLSPEEFGRRLSLYLANPPASTAGATPTQRNEIADAVGGKEPF